MRNTEDILTDLERAALDGESRFCFVSVYGSTNEARARAEEEGVVLLEAGDSTRLLLSGRVRERIRAKLKLPLLGGTELRE